MEIVQIESLKNGKKKVSFDSGESCTLYAGEAKKAGLIEHAEITEEAWQSICQDILLPRAKKRLLYLLERMDRTEHQLDQKLIQDGYPKEIREEALRYVAEYHYIDDLRYACTYIRAHEKSKSRRQMTEALFRKGIAKDCIDQAMEEAYSGESDELIRQLLEKKHYDPEAMDRAQKNKIFQSLMRKGFSTEEIRRAMDLERL